MNNPSKLDLTHYHWVIDGDGKRHVGKFPEIANDKKVLTANTYAAHTLGANSGYIGIALAGMALAVEKPFNPGRYPINVGQWEELAKLCAERLIYYKLPVRPDTLLSHAEAQGTLGKPQRGKWDIARLPWRSDLKTAREVGDDLRWRVRLIMDGADAPPARAKTSGEPPIAPFPSRTPPLRPLEEIKKSAATPNRQNTLWGRFMAWWWS